ncbi:MAG TPA: PAS domain S-box protein, partial [Thermoanaerobaculia bacterium]|nr:PAS domain S-box protein [Thermoanaerobaculia bacterium]
MPGEGAGCEGPRPLPGILGLIAALTEGSIAAIFVSVDDRIRYANRAACALTGYTHEELCGMEAWIPAHPDHRDAERERTRAREKRGPTPARYEMKLLTKRGEVRWVDVSAAAVEFEGRPAG